jgi:uncharacterized surface anchored protein
MKRTISLLLAFVLLVGMFGTNVFAADGDPLDENGDTGGTGPGGSGSLNEYWSGSWQGMRITVIDVTDTADILNGTVRGKVAAGTVSVDISNLEPSSGFFTRTTAGDGSTALTYGNKVTHFGKVSKMEYRDGEAIASTNNGYTFQPVTGLPSLMGNTQASAQTIKDYINNQAMLTQIASWCGISSYDELTSGKYKLLCEPIMYALIGTNKFAFTPTEAALFKPHGNQTGWPLINNTLANAFYLEYDELGWNKWTGSTNTNQPFQTIIDSLGMHIYSIAPDDVPLPQKGKIKIIKKDTDTNASLAGATFEVKKGGTTIGTFTTNSSGEITTGDLDFGEYTVTETAAPNGYELNTTPQTVNLTVGGATVSVTFKNKKDTPPPPSDPPPTEVEFKKVEYGTEIGLSGGVFKVVQLSHWERHLIDPNGNDLGEFYDDDNGDALNSGDPGYHHNVEDLGDDVWQWLEIRQTKDVGTFLSGSDGAIPVGELEAGSYTIEEISPPAGYVLAEALHERIQSFDVPREGGYTVKITFTNKKLPGITVIKVDEDTGLPLAGAEFSIAHKGGSVVYEGVTPADGTINLDGLSEGWYEVTELAAPHGYLIRDESKDVFLPAGGSAQIKFDNRRKPTLELVKLDSQSGQPLAGATFRVWKTEGNTIGEYTTGADGKVRITDLDDVIYSVEEISAPNGYLLDGQHKDAKLEWGKVTTLTFTDRKKPGLTITKVDEQTGAALANAEFSVAHKGGAIVYEGNTDVNGKINLTDLAEGWYTITETAAPYGYLIVNTAKDIYLEGDSVVDVRFMNRLRPTLEIIKLDEQTKAPLAGAKFRVWATEGDTVGEFVTDANGRILIPNLDDKIYSVEEIIAPDGYVLNPQKKEILLEWGKVNTLTFTNLKKPTLTIFKYDELTNQPLAGASFRLWKTEGETWSETMVTDANGRIIWTDLDPGIYSVQEIDEPYGYYKDPTRKEILLEGGDNKQLEFFNRPRPVLTILKRDAVTGQPLPDVKFKVQKTEGATIGEFLTDANGVIELSPRTGYLLDEAVYRVTEILPPNEYLLDVNPQKDVLLKWYEPTELIFENLLKPTLIFIKRDGMSGRGISGATYKVEYESPTGGVTNIGSYVTKCGLIVLPRVLPGWYSLTETSPASGYQLPTNPTQRLHLAPGENSYTYAQTHEDLYVDQRTNPNSGNRGMCGDWCGYLCSVLCAGNCGNAGDGTMASGNGGAFGNITITNGNGEVIGSNNGGNTQTDTTAPVLSAGTVTRNGDLSATVIFTSSEAGRYYYAVANSGANEPAIATGGNGTACSMGANTITVYMTSGAKDVYIKVKDASGNVSNALKISVPAYVPQTETTPATPTPSNPETPNFDNIVITGGTVVYLNPDFSGIIIKFGNY